MAAETNTHTVKVGQVYEACRYPNRIRVTAYTPGSERAVVVDAASGKRSRLVQVSDLHASDLTSQGLPRRTGYRLVKDVTP